MTLTDTIALGMLTPSRNNVRRTASEAGLAELSASIEVHGLLQGLVVRKAARGPKFEVIAGARRLAALRRLMAEGRTVAGVPVTKAFAVPVTMASVATDAELSLAENTQREAMHPVDEILAYRELVETGMAAEDIAARFGQAVTTVRQRLRLATLSTRILEAMREGAPTLEQAKALAISDDHAAQDAAWFDSPGWSRNPANLRAMLTRAHVRATDRLAQFVGVEAYAEAGGAVMRDLFDEASDTFLADPALLNALATARLEAEAANLASLGWGWTQVTLEANALHGGGYARIWPKRRDHTPEEEAELAALGERHDALSTILETMEPDDPEFQTHLTEYDAAIVRMEAIRSAAQWWDADEQAIAGCLVGIGHGGGLMVTCGLIRPEDKARLAALNPPAPDVETPANSHSPSDETAPETPDATEAGELPEPRGLSHALTEELTAIRTAALRVELAAAPKLALAAILHPLALGLFYRTAAHRTGSAADIRGDGRWLDGSIRDPQACVALTRWTGTLDSWHDRLPADPEALWGWLAGQDIDTLMALLATATAAHVNAVQARTGENTPQLRQAAMVADAVALDMRRWWNPDEAFLARLAKADIAQALREAGCSEDAATAAEKAPKADAVKLAARELDGKGWLPVPLRTAASRTAMATDTAPADLVTDRAKDEELVAAE